MFLIDLEMLKEKNVQYFIFGTDYVLKINVNVSVKQIQGHQGLSSNIHRIIQLEILQDVYGYQARVCTISIDICKEMLVGGPLGRENEEDFL